MRPPEFRSITPGMRTAGRAVTASANDDLMSVTAALQAAARFDDNLVKCPAGIPSRLAFE